MFPNINIDDRVLVVKDEIIDYKYNIGDGPISSDRIIGKAYFKIYPFSEFKNLND